MNQRHGLCLLCGFCLLLVSCDHQADNPQPAKPASVAAKPAAAPEVAGPLSIDSYRKYDLGPGTQLHVWNIRAFGLKQLATNLLIIRDGTAQTARRIEYKWEKWDKPPAAGQILLVMQDGQLFGVKDKRLPLLTVDFPELPNGSRSEAANGDIPIEGAFHDAGPAAVTINGSLLSFPPGIAHKAILYGQVFIPEKESGGTVVLSTDLDSLIKEARPGRAAVAISLDWMN